MLGSLMMLAAGVFASSPNSAKASGVCCSGGNHSLKLANMRPAREISRVVTETPAALANASTMGSSERVASAGASSVRV